ncbi:bifunctional phosphoribosyl-AMP cyclohydrolase/phosphoribosyl-ATP diphosphatase HisIE [Ornithinibacillus scapharcae]|uniref:bifunctional phosphoribosyl-AMP cyclohydrolase/phosphoribosyl-ATP diphosphatase HisIE n=1 Tax=Ornithinibacillus scapharcae TaxID=1147159 RepID=UPI000225BF42|nr:bifunctional phosphoribosyl-AMP cyclohydrolase/phosphoribosyl-ATP diphosphatase HisIE [Ornithinibacillus scapharcae]
MPTLLDNLTFSEGGLIPAIIQDQASGRVLMLAYMNRESLQKTLETKETWFFSRKRKKLWNKGETSGNKQVVKSIDFDCDSDSLLIQVSPKGPSCHTGMESCFHNTLFQDDQAMFLIIQQVVNTIKNRRANPTESSYTSYLFREGIDKILKKIGEEASEIIIGSKNTNKNELIWEISDFIFHLLVLMEVKDITISDVKAELVKRHVTKVGDLGE